MKVDYSKGKIYAIRSYSTDDVYIGSTCTTLTKRLSEHKCGYVRWLKKEHTYMTSYEVLKYGDAYIELVEECPCENKAQLNRREGEIVRSMTCVNKNVAGRTKEEYRVDNAEQLAALKRVYYKRNAEAIAAVNKRLYEKNKEYIVARHKKYNERNKARLAARAAEKVTCACGCVVTRGYLAKHEKTKKHEQYLNNLIRELDEETQAGQGAEAAGEGNE